MSISLNTGLRALLSARYVLDTIGHNIANANTPGYSRQNVQLSTAIPVNIGGLLIGSGVSTDQIQRSVDQLLGRRIQGQQSVMGSLQSRLGGLSQLESLFGEPGPGGLGQLLDGFFSSVSELSTAPDDSVLQTGLAQAALAMTERFNEIGNSLATAGIDAEAEIEARIESANMYAAEIATLNQQIGEVESGGLPANDLKDQRDLLLGKLSELVDTKTVDGPNGSVRVMVSGNTLVSSGRAHRMEVTKDTNGLLQVQLEGSTGNLPVEGGAIGGLLELSRELAPELRSRLDELAHQMILNANRVHSTGVPADGAFTNLVSSNVLEDFDQDGKVTDELLSNAGLPFDVTNGSVYVNVVDEATGSLEKHRIDISQTHTTVQDFLDSLNAISNVSAGLDAQGHVRITSSSGHGFDFSRRIDTHPDSAGTFGSGQASLGTGAQGPFALADGDTLDITVNSGGTPLSFQISFAQGDFFQTSQATADEIAAAINADPNAQTSGVVASSVDGRVFLQTAGTGANVEFTIDGGSSVAALGWTGQVGTLVTGSDNSVDVEIGGSYSGSADATYTFVPNMDGTIGTTPGLAVEVFDASGQLVATLDVGEGYVPGTELNIANGITAQFGLGDLSATNNDLFAVDLVVDSDTSDVLVALGLNSLFEGHDASTISLREDIQHDPSLISTSISGASGDNRLLLDLLSLEEADIAGLEGESLGGFYGGLVSDLGFQVATTSGAFEANDVLIQSLQQRRDQISGVNVDEELIDLLAYEQSFAAAAQYITVVNQIGDEILSLI
jgi:flagellar hook-associated protein FlgK